MTVSGTRTEPMDPADVAWLHMDRPTNLMVVNTVLWFDVPVDQASVLQVFQERVVSRFRRFRRFRQRAADPALMLAPWAAPDWVDDADFALVPGKQRAWTRPVPVAAVKAAGAAAGSTVNDLMLAVITSALRRYLLEHDALAEEVIVIVPVDLRPVGAPLPAGLGNHFGLVFVRLPTGETDQGRLRARVKAQMDQVKSSREGAFVCTMLQRMGRLPRPCRTPGSTRSPPRPPPSSPTSAARATGYRSPGHRSRA